MTRTSDRREPRSVLVALLAPLVQGLLIATGLAVASGVAWSLVAGDAGLTDRLGTTLVVVAALWMITGGTVLTRLTKLDHGPWSGSMITEDLKDDVRHLRVERRDERDRRDRRDRRPPPEVSLDPALSSVIVGLTLLVAASVAL